MNKEESVINFKTMDWEAEAKRIALAFGVEVECQFISTSCNITQRILRCYDGNILIDGLKLFVVYMEEGCLFLLQDDARQSSGLMFDCHKRASKLQWDADGSPYSDELAKGLFYLGLLDAQAESALNATIAAHQKIEWALEMGARNPQYQA